MRGASLFATSLKGSSFRTRPCFAGDVILNGNPLRAIYPQLGYLKTFYFVLLNTESPIKSRIGRVSYMIRNFLTIGQD